jgi:hypothetical protein
MSRGDLGPRAASGVNSPISSKPDAKSGLNDGEPVCLHFSVRTGGDAEGKHGGVIGGTLVGDMASIGNPGTAIVVSLTPLPSKHSAFGR